MADVTSFYKTMINTYPLLGIDKRAINLHHLPGLTSPGWVKYGAIYEIDIRSFSDEGDIAGVHKKLRYIKDLGVQIIWLTPIYPIGKKNRKGKLGCPYSVQDYYKVNPEYGAMEDLKAFIHEVHKLDMKIIVDLVANHVSNDYVEMGRHNDMFSRDDQGNYTRKIADWSDVTDLNYDLQITRDYMSRVSKFWINDVGFDGYRCDVAGMVPLDFWDETVADLKTNNPDLYMLAEWESPEHHVHAFHSTYDWTLYHTLKDIKAGKRPAMDALRWVDEKRRHYPQNALPLRFIENHDEPRAVKTFGINGVKPFAAFIFSIYGIPLIYAGQEFGEYETPSLFDKTTLNWDSPNSSLFEFYNKLMRLRKSHPALSSKEMVIIKNNQSQNVLSYFKKEQRQVILCILNLSNQELVTELEMPDQLSGDSFQNLIDNHRILIKSDTINLKTYQVIFTKFN